MNMFRENRNLLIIAIVAVVNALGYGIVIPVLYSYSVRYGLSDFQNGLLFSVFSICQFASTPIIGRMSDKYGRRPLLIISILGTALSFLLMAFAPSAIFLFLARALDGITAGNLPVAAAVISDTTTEEHRAKGFGIIGASFGFGFIFGPAISGATVDISPSLPFIIASVVSFIAVVICLFFLPETNKHMGEVRKGRLFDFSHLLHALFAKNIGPVLLISLFYFTAFGTFIYAFQPFSVKGLHLSVQHISFLFTVIGCLGLFSQIVLLPRATKMFGVKKTLCGFLSIITIACLGIFFSPNVVIFIGFTLLFGLFNSTVMPLVQTVLSEETDAKSQGTIQGLNSSYMSIGQIIGPIAGGALATFMISLPFLLTSFCVFICLLLSFKVLRRETKKESAF